jgi:hypothetical protein
MNRQYALRQPCGTPAVSRDRLANGRFDETQERRIAAFEGNSATSSARPQSGRRSQRQFIGKAQLDFLDAQSPTARIIGLVRPHELEVDPVIEQQPE